MANFFSYSFLFVYFVIFTSHVVAIFGQLTPNFYRRVCPPAMPQIRNAVRRALRDDPRMGASLLRLHFHDCFVNGCDGSVLLDDTPTFIGEKTAFGNINSLRGFDVIDEIKSRIDRVCRGNIISCADILAIAARDSIELLGGPSYQVLLGRRDARTASLSDANANLPSPFVDLQELLLRFQDQGLDLQDLVVLSGGHTLGQAQCSSFRSRIYSNSTEERIERTFRDNARQTCPVNGGDTNLQPFDATPNRFDNQFFRDLVSFRGLLHSDQQLFSGDGGDSDQLVRRYANNPAAFAADFRASMIKMGNIRVLTGSAGEIRRNCRRVNDAGLYSSIEFFFLPFSSPYYINNKISS